MFKRCHAVSLALFLSACAAHDDGSKPEGSVPVAVKPTPEVKPEPKPEAKVAVTVAVASVQLIQDCPDPAEPAEPATPAAAQPAPGAPMPAAESRAQLAAGASAKVGPRRGRLSPALHAVDDAVGAA
jgi:hypothetical protein